MDAVTSIVDGTASLVRDVGDATAATLGATVKVTGSLARGLGHAVDSVGEAQVVDRGPWAAPSRVVAGIFTVAGAVVSGAGNATVGLGGAIESIAGATSKVAEDTVRAIGEPTRAAGRALQRGSTGQRAWARPVAPEDAAEAPHPPRPPFFSWFTRRRRRQLLERVVRRLLGEAFEHPSDRMVALAPSLIMGLLAAWFLGRGSLDQCQASDSTRLLARLRKRGKWACQAGGLIVILLLVIRVDQGQQRHESIMQELQREPGMHESVRWLNEAIAMVWSPLIVEVGGAQDPGLNTSVGTSPRPGAIRGGLGLELAKSAAASLNSSFQGSGDDDYVWDMKLERLSFGDTPPVLGRVRMPSEKTSTLLMDAIEKAKAAARISHGRNVSLDTHTIFLEADLGWSVDAGFEIVVKASAASGVHSSIASRVLPQLRLRLANMVLGPAPLAIALEAAPQGYPYLGLIALTFLKAPDLDFSAAPLGALGGTLTTVPLVREALTAQFSKSLPLAEEGEILVYDLGEWLAPGARDKEMPWEVQGAAEAGNVTHSEERDTRRWSSRMHSWLRRMAGAT